MPEFPNPVLLGIDLDFLPEFAGARGIPELEAARRLVATLGAKAPRRIHLVLSYSTGDEYTPILLRWLGDAVLMMLRLFPSVPPPESERPWAFLASAEGLRKAGAYDALVTMLKNRSPSSPEGTAGLLYLAEALYFRNDIHGAFEACREACRLDKRAAGIFFWIGKSLAIEGCVDEAARFIAAGREADSQARDWQAEAYLALAMKQAGRDGEAMAILDRLAAAYASYSAEFLVGAMLLDRGDRRQAERRFENALRRLESSPDLEVDLPEVRQAVISAARFYDRTGRPDMSGRLRGDVRFRGWFLGEGSGR
jgi:tetratricopeptide (TPR) repeat protein